MNHIYGAYNKEIIRDTSSSGGVCGALAAHVLNKGGVVYASLYDDEKLPKYARISDYDEIKYIVGAKYAESKLGDAFINIREDIKRLTVLFIGTPCHCYGLKQFIGENENLFCIDFICHGVPSRKVLKSYLYEIENSRGKRIKHINMRDKFHNWQDYGWKLVFHDGSEEMHYKEDVAYMTGFVNGLFLRPSCYSCRFKANSRTSDITVGDLWGGEQYFNRQESSRGLSLCILNTAKGEMLFEHAKELLYIKMLPDEYNLANCNPSYYTATYMNEYRIAFFDEYSNGNNCHTIINKYCKKPSVNTKKKLKRLLNI